MVDYYEIIDEGLIGTLKYCIQNFPEDFKAFGERVPLALKMANQHQDYEVPYMLRDINPKDTMNTCINSAYLSPKLLREDFFDPKQISILQIERAFNMYIEFNTYKKAFKFRSNLSGDYHIKMFIRKILKHKMRIDKDTFEKFYPRLPKHLRTYFLKHLDYDNHIDNTIPIILFIYNNYEALNDFFRICRPNIAWDLLINAISEETFYKIISITNTLNHYERIYSSYIDMKKKYQKSNRLPTGHPLIEEYLKNMYEQQSSMKDLLNANYERPSRDFSCPIHMDYTVRRPHPIIHTTI